MPLWTTPPDWFDLERRLANYFPSSGFGASSRSMGFHSHHSDGYNDTDPLHRLKCVKDAFVYANTPAVLRLGRRFVEIDIREIVGDLLESVAEMARILVASMLLGGAVGGAVGGLAGGVGAIPGVAMGTAVGLKAGSWILGLLGLSAIADFFIDGLPNIVSAYERGVNTAWGAPPQNRLPFSHSESQEYLTIYRAAEQIAEAHEAMVILLLSAIVAYLARNHGAKAGLMQQMSKTARGERLAKWVAKHEQALKQHPLLKVPEPAMTTGALRHEPVTPPSATARDAGTRPRRGRRMARIEVPCFSAKRMPYAKIPEFDRQLAGQERGLNALTIDEYVRGRAAFTAGDIKRDSQKARVARMEYARNIQILQEKELMADGASPIEARRLAKFATDEKMSALAALHNPDLIGGGQDKISDFGDRQVNSSIGPQWKSRARYLDEAVQEYMKSVSPSELKTTHQQYMSASLIRCI